MLRLIPEAIAQPIGYAVTERVSQVFVPAVNRGLMVAVAALVIGFGSSQALASAYGIAVTGTLAIDTILFFVVVRALWGKPLWMAIAGASRCCMAPLAAAVPNDVRDVTLPLLERGS